MLKLEIKHITLGNQEEFYGSESACEEYIDSHFPEARKFFSLREKVDAVNQYGDAEVEVETYAPSTESNLLPEDYLTHQEQEPERH